MNYSLTNPQNSIWLTEKFYTGSSVNNICGYVYISDVVDFSALKKAINELVKTNDGMRLKFKEENNSCVQYLNDYKEFDIDVIELSSEKDIEKKALEMANIPFEIKDNFLFKFILFKLPNGAGGFIVNVHHIIGDSWTLGLVAKEVTGIYSDILNSTYEEKEFPSYLNYINYEKEYVNSDKFNKDKVYWNDVFKTVPEIASIPSTKISSSKNISCSGNREKFIIPEKQINEIKEFCTKNKISVYNFFMAAYSIYLGRVSNLDDFVIGTPILNRTNFEQKHTMGMFISTAPLRINLEHDKSFIDFSKLIASNSMSLLRHQRYPYQAILEDLRKKDSNIPNLYNVVLSYQITKTIEENSNIKYSTDWVFNGNSADDLQIHLFDLHDDTSITVAYDYKSDKYDSQDIKDLHSRILTLINQIIGNNEILLKDIEVVTPEEKQKILNEFNNTKVDYPHDKTIVDLFEEQAQKTPDNIAVVFEDQRLTYRELNEKANQLANFLLDNKISNNDVVALFLDKSLEVIISIIATLKVGATYLPLDIDYPQNRLDYILDNSKAKIILTTHAEKEFTSALPIAYVDCESNIYTRICNFRSNPNIQTSDLAYITYTSGSTGNPKGVMIQHKNVVRLVKNTNYITFSPNDRILQTGSIVFDASTFEIFGALLNGLCVYIMKKEDLLNPNMFEQYIVNNKITTLFLTTALFNKFCEFNPKMFNNLKYLLTGGEAVSNKHMKITRLSNPSLELLHVYGPTENTTFSTYYPVSNNLNCFPIGKPISNSTAYIVSSLGSLCPVGVPGELWVGGDGVAKGYLNNESLTKDKFIQNPFDEGIIYKTGDLVKWLPDGNIEFIGRIDNQVKIRGFRIELSEIDNTILTYNDIKQSISVIHNINNSKFICSYIVAENTIDTKKLKEYLSKTLANYMIPTYITQLDKLPLNINGKVDRKLLPVPSNTNNSDNIVEARNDIDKTILVILKDLFNLENISIDDNLFDLGIDSLSSITLANNISNKLETQISVKDIFNNSSIQELSDYISTFSEKRSINTIKKAEKMKYYPLSSAQKRMYYSSNLDNNSTLYNIAGGVIVDKLLDVNKLKACFDILINRHEALRTHFDIVDNEVVQIIDDTIDFKLDLDNTNTDDLNRIYTDFVKPFDLSKAPLFRTKLVKLNDNKMLLLLDMHHIISDGTSLGILLQELCDLYNGSTLPEKQIDYKDFTLWEKEQFKSDEFKLSKKYWVNQFKDEIPLLNMPTTYPRPSVQSFEGSNYHTTLSKDVFDRVNKVAKELNITPYMLMLSCYYILLSKYTSQDDIVVGTPIVGRELPELSNMLGMFVNTLAMRNKVDSSLNFAEFSKLIKENSLNSFKNQGYPFDMLVKELNIKRDTSRSPLFDVMFIYQNNGYPEINFKDTKAEYFVPDNNVAKFDLSLEVVPIDDEYSLRFEYCTKLFNEEFIKRLSTHYINILNAILENNDIMIANIDMLSEEEKNQILYKFNDTKVDYPKDKTIVDLFEEQVAKTPDNIAVVFEDQKLTYKELNEKANQLARFLLVNNVAVSDIVGILLDKSLETIISILGILKTGATFLPIDVSYPNERIEYIINDSKANIVLTNQNFIHKINDNVQPLSIDNESSYFSLYDDANLNIEYDVNNTAYIMYTSGSTGNPKGVMVTHKNIVRLVKNNKFITFNKEENILQTGSIVFDACTFEIWSALLNGFKLFIMKKEDLLDATILEKYLEKNKITTLWLTAPLFNQLCETNPYMFKNVKKLLTGGDVLSPKHINMVRKSNPDLTVINGYGPTENTTFSCCFTIDKKYNNSIPIGKPISNSTAYIVSSSGSLCPIGVPGELWVGGDGVAKGYLNNESLTKDKFIQNPFDEGIIYKTGDLVKWLPDGNIEFIGRIDNQVKIRGFRIELSEIDNTILTYNNIKQSISVIHNINNSKFICSYIVAENTIDTKKLKEYLSKTLANYMIPTYITQLDKLPLNINGKVDRKLLPVPSNTNNSDNIVKARNDIDKTILGILKDLFNLENISIDDNLFDLGIDSLSSITLANNISNKLETQISVKDIFNHSSIQELSDYISTFSEKRSINTIKKAEKMKYYPLSSAQKRMYYSSNLDNNSTLYNIAGGVIVDNLLDVNKLKACFDILVDRHEALRTHFDIVDNEVVQIIDAKVDFKLDLENINTDNLNKVYSDFVKPFDLSKAPLFRTKLVKLNDNKMLLLLDMHHIISDGTSLGILLQELCDLYNNNELVEKELDYKDFTLWEKEQFESNEFKLSKEYWVNQFKDEIPLLNMPTTYSRPSVQSFEGSNYHTTLSKDIFDRVNKASKELNITPYMLMLSCYYILLSKYTSQDDIVIGTPIVGRELPELSNMLGMFVNTLAMRNKVDSSLNFAEFSKLIKENSLNSFKNQGYPFDMLVKELNIKRDTSRSPLFDVMFIYQNNGYPEINFKDTKAEYFVPDNNVAKFDLSLEIVPIEDEFSLRFEYCTKLFDEEFIKRLSTHYINILNAILENNDIKIANIDMLSEEEKNQILYDFNNTKVDYPKDKTIVDLFEEQVAKTPDNIAIVFENQKLTYKELNEKANQLARYLIENGISNNSIVGIMVPRSLEMMIGILGVLKSGACYVPIDPSFPKERIEYMLQNSNTLILLKTTNIKNISFENMVDIDITNTNIYELKETNINNTIDQESLSYVIYTSGSTGKPKGVALKHKALYNLANYLNNNVAYFKDIYANLAIASITTISFDIFLFETIISLQRGLKVVIANEKEQTNPSLLDSLIEKHNVKAIQMTPSRIEIFINNKEYMPHLSKLKYITLAGEALSLSLKNELLKLGNITIYNGYGPSETTVFSTFTNVTKQENITIGKPLSNTYMYVLDRDNHLCPIGIPGELYISGDGVGMGYLNNKDLTNKSFINDHFNNEFTMYKTGDLVKLLPNNELHYIGRTDNQVKIRGLRIELDEIQKWISEYKDINKVVLSSNKDKNGRQYIVAYLTVTNRISINNLKMFLNNHIPKYMIPTHFVILDDLPYLPNGKVNKKALPLPNDKLSSTKKYIAPVNKLEIDIIQIFENLLSISPISTDDNFFDIGGDSLLAMSLQLELLKLNINVTYSDIFMFPSAKELANHISADSKRSINKIDTDEIYKFDTILNNTINLPDNLKYFKPGNVLLAGVTGFLGAHILDSLLKNETGVIYCFIRLEPGLTIEQKLLNKLHYYFGNKYDSLIGTRIIPIKADISINNFGLTDADLNDLANKIDIVINSAAKVSHYGNYGDYKKVNVDGTQNLTDFSIKNNKRFYQISTLSVSGNSLIDDSYIKQKFENDIDFNENNFYINQALDNVYVRSKFEAERIVLNNILNGLDGYIIRVGNLMNRFSDGKFQSNVEENAYINRLLTYYKIGYIPDYLLNGYLELTPIDYCADAILKIIQYNSKSNRMFHLLNHKNINVLYFIDTLNKFYDKIEIVNNEKFIKVIDKFLNNANSKNILSGLINDFDENKLIVYSSPVKIKSDFTVKYLNKIGFEWPELTEEYIIKFLKFFDNLNLLDKKEGI